MDQTPLSCPACGKTCQLHSRNLGTIAALECGRCAGLWLGNAAFDLLMEKAAEAGSQKLPLFVGQPIRPSSPGFDSATQQKSRYRPCPECEQLMWPRHYGRRSGVIIDVCRDHGIWFDADELPRILEWIRLGGLARAKDELTQNAEMARRRKQPAAGGTGRFVGGPHNRPDTELFSQAMGAFVTWLTRF